MLRKTTPASACCRLCQQMVSDPHPSSHTRDCRSGNYNFPPNNLEDTGAGAHVHHGDGPYLAHSRVLEASNSPQQTWRSRGRGQADHVAVGGGV